MLIYVLVDHKSYPDRWVVLQLLVYMVRIWEKERSQNRKLKELPCIIPVILYHGARKWMHPLAFSSYVNAEEQLDSYVPDFRLVMFNLQNVDLDMLLGGLTVKIALKAFKYALKGLRSHLREILQSIPNLPVDSQTRTFFSRLLEYITQVGGYAKAEDLEEELESVAPDVSREVLMTIEEQLLERGTIREKQQILIRLLEKKFAPLDDDNKQCVLDNKDREKLDSAIDLILDAGTVTEVLSPLG